MIYAVLGIPIVLAGIATVALVVTDPCTHEMFPKVHQPTGKIYRACRCGERFEREPDR